VTGFGTLFLRGLECDPVLGRFCGVKGEPAAREVISAPPVGYVAWLELHFKGELIETRSVVRIVVADDAEV
jgi:hypothetical protein